MSNQVLEFFATAGRDRQLCLGRQMLGRSAGLCRGRAWPRVATRVPLAPASVWRIGTTDMMTRSLATLTGLALTRVRQHVSPLHDYDMIYNARARARALLSNGGHVPPPTYTSGLFASLVCMPWRTHASSWNTTEPARVLIRRDSREYSNMVQERGQCKQDVLASHGRLIQTPTTLWALQIWHALLAMFHTVNLGGGTLWEASTVHSHALAPAATKELRAAPFGLTGV